MIRRRRGEKGGKNNKTRIMNMMVRKIKNILQSLSLVVGFTTYSTFPPECIVLEVKYNLLERDKIRENG